MAQLEAQPDEVAPCLSRRINPASRGPGRRSFYPPPERSRQLTDPGPEGVTAVTLDPLVTAFFSELGPRLGDSFTDWTKGVKPRFRVSGR